MIKIQLCGPPSSYTHIRGKPEAGRASEKPGRTEQASTTTEMTFISQNNMRRRSWRGGVL